MTIQDLKQLLSIKFKNDPTELRKAYQMCALLEEPIVNDDVLALHLISKKIPLSDAVLLVDEMLKQIANTVPDPSTPEAYTKLTELVTRLNIMEQTEQLKRLWKRHVNRIDFDFKVNRHLYDSHPKYHGIMFKP